MITISNSRILLECTQHKRFSNYCKICPNRSHLTFSGLRRTDFSGTVMKDLRQLNVYERLKIKNLEEKKLKE
jgi:hypothetical protein